MKLYLVLIQLDVIISYGMLKLKSTLNEEEKSAERY